MSFSGFSPLTWVCLMKALIVKEITLFFILLFAEQGVKGLQSDPQ